MKTEQRLLEELAKIDVANLTSEMVKIPSYSFMEEQEREIARYIGDHFTAEGIENEVIEIEPGEASGKKSAPRTFFDAFRAYGHGTTL